MTSQLLFRKTVDKFVLNQGLGISLNFASSIYDEFGYIDTGKSKNVKVFIGSESFSAKLFHTNIIRRFLQIKYFSSEDSLPKRLRDIFQFTNEFVEECDECKKSKKSIPILEESEKEYIDIKLIDDGFRFICYPKGSEIQSFKRNKLSNDSLDIAELDEQLKNPNVTLANKIPFLLAKGKLQGFIEESDIFLIIPESISEEKIKEVFNTIVANNIELRWKEY